MPLLAVCFLKEPEDGLIYREHNIKIRATQYPVHKGRTLISTTTCRNQRLICRELHFTRAPQSATTTPASMATNVQSAGLASESVPQSSASRLRKNAKVRLNILVSIRGGRAFVAGRRRDEVDRLRSLTKVLCLLGITFVSSLGIKRSSVVIGRSRHDHVTGVPSVVRRNNIEFVINAPVYQPKVGVPCLLYHVDVRSPVPFPPRGSPSSQTCFRGTL